MGMGELRVLKSLEKDAGQLPGLHGVWGPWICLVTTAVVGLFLAVSAVCVKRRKVRWTSEPQLGFFRAGGKEGQGRKGGTKARVKGRSWPGEGRADTLSGNRVAQDREVSLRLKSGWFGDARWGELEGREAVTVEGRDV